MLLHVRIHYLCPGSVSHPDLYSFPTRRSSDLWPKRGADKAPRLFRLKGGEPFAFAGLWESGGFALITVEPNPLVARIHDRDRKSTRLNSSHANISYAVFCLKKKTSYTNTLLSV